MKKLIVNCIALWLRYWWKIHHALFAHTTQQTYISPIPKHIHQIWIGEKPLPETFRTYVESWKLHHPNFKHALWTDADIEQLEKESPLPSLFYEAESISTKSDAFRFYIINRYGGVYVDTDFECFKSIEPLLQDYEFVSAKQNISSIACGFFASIPHHPFLEHLIAHIPQRTQYIEQNSHRQFDAAASYGPEYFTTEWHAWSSQHSHEKTCILPRKYMYPHSWLEQHLSREDLVKNYPYMYAFHHWSGSWKMVD